MKFSIIQKRFCVCVFNLTVEMNASLAFEMLLVLLAILSTAKAQTLANPSSNPPSGYTFSYDLNQPGPTITCIGYANLSGTLFQQNTVWKVGPQTVVASSVFALSSETIPIGGFGQTNLTILNVTNNLDGSTITCGVMISGSFQQIATFAIKIYRAPVLKMVGVVNGLKDSSVTFQIGDLASPPPYPAPFWNLIGIVTLSVAQLQYSHPNLTLSGLTEANSGSYVFTAENFRTNGLLLGASNGTFTLNVQFPPVIAAGISQTAAVQGQPFPVSLQCGTNLMGNPAPTVQWRTKNMGTVVISGGRYSIDNGPCKVLLNISNVDWTINGTWTCILSNGVFAPVFVNISLFVLVPPSQPLNVTNGLVPLSNTKSQLSVSWQPPLLSGVPSLSLYTVVARDPTNHTTSVTAAQTFVTFYGLLAGLPYDITVYAISSIGATNAVSNPSATLVLSTDPDVPTVVCNYLAAGPGNVNVSWIIEYDGGRPVTAIQIEYKQYTGAGGSYQAVRSDASPNMTSAVIMEQFVASLSYAFVVLASNVIGNSTLSDCGQITITEGIPPAPKPPTIFAYGPTWVVLTLSTTASGAGATESFAFHVVSADPTTNVNQIFPFPSYLDGSKVNVNVTNLMGVEYFFNVYASNVYGTSDPVNVLIPSKTQSSSTADVIAVGVLGAITGLLLILIAIVVIYFIVCCRAHAIKQKNTEPVELEENTAYGVVHTEVCVDVKENTAYGMIPRADKGKDNVTVKGPTFRK